MQALFERIVWTCVLAAFPSSLFAVDGVVSIDQTKALAGSVTHGDAPGFPVTISQPGSYRLTGNLVVTDPDTTAILISADLVTLDLNGFSILGPAVCTGRPTTCPPAGRGIGVQSGGDQLVAPRGIRVLNGSIRGMGTGIMLAGDGSFVNRVTVDGNPGGGMSVPGSVIESTATRNGGFGIIAVIVRDSTASENLGDGIILDAVGGVGTGNVASFNEGSGIVVQFGTATGNSIFLNKSFGISALCPSSIGGNTIVSTSTGSQEIKGSGCVLSNNATRPGF